MNLFIIPSLFFMISFGNFWQYKNIEEKEWAYVPPAIPWFIILTALFNFLSLNMLLPWHWFWVLLFLIFVAPFISKLLTTFYNFKFGVKRKEKNILYGERIVIDRLKNGFITFAIGIVSLITCFIVK